MSQEMVVGEEIEEETKEWQRFRKDSKLRFRCLCPSKADSGEEYVCNVIITDKRTFNRQCDHQHSLGPIELKKGRPKVYNTKEERYKARKERETQVDVDIRVAKLLKMKKQGWEDEWERKQVIIFFTTLKSFY